MLKRTLAIALALVMVLALVGCGNAASTATSTAAPTSEAASTAETAGTAAPAGFPAKDITLVNPYEAGGTSDIPARIYAENISAQLNGKMMNVSDVTGSGGAVGAQQVMNADGDGYTLLVAPAGYAMQYAKGSCEFTQKDFKPVCLFVTSYLTMAVNAESGIETYEQLVEAAKAANGEMKFGVATGGLPMFCVLAMEQKEGITFNTVDIGGTTLKAPELLSGRIDVMIDSLAGVSSYVESGDFNILGVYADDRFENYADVPTFKELGYDTNVMNQVFGIWAPKDTPDDVVDYLAGLFENAANDPDVQKQLTDLTYSASFIDTDEYNVYLDNMYTDFGEFAKQLK